VLRSIYGSYYRDKKLSVSLCVFVRRAAECTVNLLRCILEQLNL
jgi:hypothetical protein